MGEARAAGFLFVSLSVAQSPWPVSLRFIIAVSEAGFPGSASSGMVANPKCLGTSQEVTCPPLLSRPGLRSVLQLLPLFCDFLSPEAT